MEGEKVPEVPTSDPVPAAPASEEVKKISKK
jgi:hypothetical protein